MERLSAQDAAFLYLETPETPMHIGSVTIFAPRPGVTADQIFHSFREHTAARLDLLPSYRRRLQTRPLGIDHPVWVYEKTVDLDYHIRRTALPRPGTMAQLRDLVADLHARALDRNRPLWQYYLIEGLEDGGFALYVRVHHAAMDGVAGVAAMASILDFSPEPAPLAPPSDQHREPGRAPGFFALLANAVEDFLEQDVRVVRGGPKFIAALATAGRRAVTTLRRLPQPITVPPRTLFNRSISAERCFGTASISLSHAKLVAKARHATINDIVLAVSAGALRRYLAAKKDLPRKALIAGVPVSLRELGHTELNNQSAMVFATLATDCADPLVRLDEIARSSRETRALFAYVKPVWPLELSLPGAPMVIAGFAQLVARARFFDVAPPLMNVVISNVPGPRQPMYCAGAAARHYFPVSIPYHGCALNITAQSYLDQIEFGLVSCRATVPDVQAIAELMVDEFETLKRAAAAIADAGEIELIELAPPALLPPAAAEPRAAATASSQKSTTRMEQPRARRNGRRRPAKDAMT